MSDTAIDQGGSIFGDRTRDRATLTASIVTTYLNNNTVATADLPGLFGTIRQEVDKMFDGGAVQQEARREPAVPIDQSITEEYLICLEDGQHFKSLKRHLQAAYGLTPTQYRAKWNLPKDYPMAAPAYAAQRSAMAKESGLGQKPPVAAAAPAKAKKAAPTPAPAKGRKTAAAAVAEAPKPARMRKAA